MTSRSHAHPVRAVADKHDSMSREYSSDKTRCTVAFWLPSEAAPIARAITVAGSFNDWSLDRHPMKRLENGDFSLAIELPAGQEYRFRFVIDGVRWENAWNADKYVWCDYAQCENSVVAT